MYAILRHLRHSTPFYAIFQEKKSTTPELNLRPFRYEKNAQTAPLRMLLRTSCPQPVFQQSLILLHFFRIFGPNRRAKFSQTPKLYFPPKNDSRWSRRQNPKTSLLFLKIPFNLTSEGLVSHFSWWRGKSCVEIIKWWYRMTSKWRWTDFFDFNRSLLLSIFILSPWRLFRGARNQRYLHVQIHQQRRAFMTSHARTFDTLF